MENIIIAILQFLGVVSVPLCGLLIYLLKERKEAKKQLAEKEEKIQELNIRSIVINELLTITSALTITKATERVFVRTKADRFLLLFAINGKRNFNLVSVFFESHQQDMRAVDAIARYKNVEIDDFYRRMLKEAEANEDSLVILDVSKMDDDSLLKAFYQNEGVAHSKIRFLRREHLDSENDIVIFASVATHCKTAFTKRELAYIKTQMEGTIKPAINEVMDKLTVN